MALTMTLKLNAPGMTSLHKAGLAGLYMTLRAFDDRSVKIDGLKWELGAKQVTLHWLDEKPKAAFEQLIAKSFWIDTEGFIRLAGLEANSALGIEERHHLYEALNHSFFQHGPYCPKESKRTLPYRNDMDGKLRWIKDFAPVKEVKPYKEAGQRFIDSSGDFNESIEAKGWLYPGGGKRHEVYDKTTLSEPIGLALALMYAPVGVIYYRLKSRSKGRKARFAMVIPEISDLQIYCEEVRQAISNYKKIDMTASSASDAALRFVTHLAGSDTQQSLKHFSEERVHCRVVTFGIVAWDEKHKTRTFTHSVISEKLKGLDNYRIANSIFQNHWQKGAKVKQKDEAGNVTEEDSYFMSNFTAREFIADNIARGNVWYRDLAVFISHKEALKGLSYERKELHQMVKEAKFDDVSEKLFIDVCQESWRRRMGKLSERVGREGTDRQTLVQKEFEKLRVSISHSRNAHTLRETIVDLWARAGRNEGLQSGGIQKLLPFFDEGNWRKARDLALLALISYQPRSPEERELLSAEEEESTNE